MKKTRKTAPRKPSRLKAILRAVWFVILLLAAVGIQSLIAWDGYSFSDYGSTVIVVSFELNWLHNYADVPGVKGYAQELLKADLPGLPFGLVALLFYYWVPLVLFGIGVNAMLKRRITKLQFAIVSYSFLYILLASIFSPEY